MSEANWAITGVAHPESGRCERCFAELVDAISTASVTGSTGATYGRGQGGVDHSITVARITDDNRAELTQSAIALVVYNREGTVVLPTEPVAVEPTVTFYQSSRLTAVRGDMMVDLPRDQMLKLRRALRESNGSLPLTLDDNTVTALDEGARWEGVGHSFDIPGWLLSALQGDAEIIRGQEAKEFERQVREDQKALEERLRRALFLSRQLPESVEHRKLYQFESGYRGVTATPALGTGLLPWEDEEEDLLVAISYRLFGTLDGCEYVPIHRHDYFRYSTSRASDGTVRVNGIDPNGPLVDAALQLLQDAAEYDARLDVRVAEIAGRLREIAAVTAPGTDPAERQARSLLRDYPGLRG